MLNKEFGLYLADNREFITDISHLRQISIIYLMKKLGF